MTGIRHAWVGLMLALACAPMVAQAADKPEGRQTIAVLEFHVRQGGREFVSGLGRQLADRVTAKLLERNRFDVVERARLDRVLAELKIHTGGLVSDETAAEIGKLSGARFLVSGTIDSATQTVRGKSRTLSVAASIRVVATQTGRVILAQTYSGTGGDLARALDEVAGPFSRELVPDTRPGALFDLDMESATAKITLGRNAGVDRETFVEVVRQGKQIRDPLTGESLGRDLERLCMGKVVAAEERFSTIELGRLSKPSPLDIVISRGKQRWKRLSGKDLQALSLDKECLVRVVPENSR